MDWFATTWSTRLNNPRTGGMVIVGQRLHERDLFGHLLELGGFEHLCLPAEYEPSHPFCWPDDPRWEPGALLWPAQFGRPELEQLRRRLGSDAAAGQLQQRPAPAGGGLIHSEWWRFYPPGEFPFFDDVLESWDLAFGAARTATTLSARRGEAWARTATYCARPALGSPSSTPSPLSAS